jgi:hypothetical protein
MRASLLALAVAASLACGGFAGEVKDVAQRQTVAKIEAALDRLTSESDRAALRPLVERIRTAVKAGNVDLQEIVALGLEVDAAVKDGALSAEEIATLTARVEAIAR